MKILHFGRFYNDRFGGLERHVDLLINAIKSSVERVDNVVANERPRLDVLEKSGYRVYKVPTFGVWAGTPLCPTMPAVVDRIQRPAAYDIHHLHFPDPMSHWAWRRVRHPGRLVITWHSDIIRQRFLLKLYRPFLLDILSRVDAVLVATPRHVSSSAILQGHVPPEKLFVVPYGLDYAGFEGPEVLKAAADVRARYRQPLVFAVGRHVYYKGFEYLIDAMRAVPDALLVLGGSGPLTRVLMDRVRRLRLSDRVHFVGRIPDHLLGAYYHAAEIVCMPSVAKSEAFGLVQLEAMACRRPVISTELGNGVSYVNQDGVTGFTVAPKDSKALADAINILLRDRGLREAMGEAGHHRATCEFSIERMAKGTLDVYRKILD